MVLGKLIVFEGINGCGKGTQINLLTPYILSQGKAVPVFLTGEPNDFDENGRKAREILHSEGNPYENANQASRLFAENRRTHNKIFAPMLKRGITVISDRYYGSQFVFQNEQGILYKEIAKANDFARVPDLTFLLDVPVDVAFERLSHRDIGDRRKFDRNFNFMEKAREKYLVLPKILPKLMKDKLLWLLMEINLLKKFLNKLNLNITN